ncbi:MAG: hypothetical protein C0593_07025 [Marinilabiliales bacterium]|nr:MAG: hypothetical protein C0593_07025 [Marinilabiliales bacterium]
MRSIFTLLMLILSAGFLFGQEVQQSFHFSNPEVTITDGYANFSFTGTQSTGITGEPAIPYQMVSLLIPQGHEAVSVNVEYLNEVALPGTYVIVPVQPSQPVSKPEKHPFAKNEAVYSLDGIYPAETEGVLSTGFYSGHSIASCAITPLRFNPAKKTVSYFTDVLVTIETAPSAKAKKATALLRNDNRILASLERIIQNTDALKSYNYSNTKDSDDYDNLIICPSQFISDMEALQELYLKRGLKTEIVAIEDIYAQGAGQDNQEKIRNYIIDEYTGHGVSYVLLGGDVELFPYRGFYCAVQSSSLYEDYNIPSDLYYSALDGTLDDDNDGVWGEIGEDDLLPEVSVARFSFNTATELQNMINKTVMYQDSPITGELNNPLLAGEHLYDNPLTWGADYLDLLVGYHDDNGYTTNGIPEDHPYLTMYDRDQTWSKSDLINAINQGHSFIHHSGHSNSTYTMRMYNSDITNSNFYGVNGTDHNYTLVYTHGCICGAFDDSDCIAERMVNIENFVVAGAYNSRYGWFNEGQTEGPSAHLHREFVDALYNDRQNRIGEAHLVSRTETAPWVNAPGQHEEGALRWCFYDCNIFGDPALAVWTDEPVEISATYASAMVIGETNLEVDVMVDGAAGEGYTCALVYDNWLYGAAVADVSGHAVIELEEAFTEPCEAKLYISGYNAIPQEYIVTVVPGEGAYVVAGPTVIHDENGNNNGMAEFGETLVLESTMKNVGQQEAANVVATISSADQYLTINDNEQDFGTIAASGEVTIADAFEVLVANNTPDQHEVEIMMDVTDGTENWQYAYSFMVNAPDVLVDAIRVIDNTGNNNGRLDPGEVVTIEVDLFNSGHAMAMSGSAELISPSSFITVNSNAVSVNDIAVSSLTTVEFGVTVSETAQVGDIAEFGVVHSCGDFNFTGEFQLVVGIILEDFETGDFSSFPWAHSGNANWTITESAPFEGIYAAQSGVINDNQQTGLAVTMNVTSEGEISFFMKVSSEGDYDFLQFYIDDVMKDEWSGAIAWEEHSYTVQPGTHTFKWSYMKDGYVSSGSDMGWVDYIEFPPSTIETGIDDNEVMTMKMYPNPVTDRIFIDTPADDSRREIMIFSLSGELIRTVEAGSGATIMINVADLVQGTYIISSVVNGKIVSGTFIKQ